MDHLFLFSYEYDMENIFVILLYTECLLLSLTGLNEINCDFSQFVKSVTPVNL